MANSIFNRRDFLKNSALIGTGCMIVPDILNAQTIGKSDISVATGSNYFDITIKAIENLGGISKFVPKGSKVGLTINAPNWWARHGSHTNTEVVLAILKLLNDAGAKEIMYLIAPADEFYKRTEKSAQFESIIKSVKMHSGEYKPVEIAKGVSLKKANVIKDLFDCDVFINVPVNKDHSGTNFTGCLKNFMGNCNRETNKFFHDGSGKSEDVEFLNQCIADVNLVRKPELCVIDATEVLKTNGPAGPGEILKPQKVFAGTDPVAMDAYGTTLLGLKPENVRSTVLAGKLGLGNDDLKNINIKEVTL